MDAPGISINILRSALTGLEIWEQRRTNLDEFLDSRHVSADCRRAVSSLLFAYFRNKPLIDNLIAAVAAHCKPRYRRLFAAVLCQTLFHNKIAPQSAVNVAVSYAAARFGKSPSSYINAILRKLLTINPDEFKAGLSADAAAGIPPVLFSRWRENYGKTGLEQIILSLHAPIPFVFRVRTAALTDLMLKPIARPAADFPWSGNFRFMIAGTPSELFAENWLKQGMIYIQDSATAMAPAMAGENIGPEVLDLCAAPGGKSIMLAEKLVPGGRLIAADRSEARQQLTAENFRRCHIPHAVITAPAAELPFAPESFDLVLADVPCSNTGVLRRRPDAMWRFSPEKLHELTILQREIMAAAERQLKTGGKLIYSTCSIEPEENSQQVKSFLVQHPSCRLQKEIQLLPDCDHDGGYAALMIKLP